jgi:hypothetical protein
MEEVRGMTGIDLSRAEWSDLEAVPEPASGESRIADYSPFGRVVFPVALLDSGDFRQA